MSEHITHVAVYEDCMRILRVQKRRYPAAFHESLDKNYDSGLFCSGSRGNHLYAVPILKEKRELWAKGDHLTTVTSRIAGALGWITHRAADLQMKPLFRTIERENNPLYSSSVCQIYHDAVSFKEVYRGGLISTLSPLELFSPALLEPHMESHTGSQHVDVKKLEPLYTHFLMKEKLELNVFTQQPTGDIEQFVEGMVKFSQDYSEDLRLYIEAFQNPDPDLYQKFVTGLNYYDSSNEILQLVRAIQQGGEVMEDELLEALEKASNQSQYAQALRKGMQFLDSAARFFQNEIDEDTVIRELEI